MNKRRTALITNKSNGGVLPSEYQRVDKIILDNNSYIDLGMPFLVEIDSMTSTKFECEWEQNGYYAFLFQGNDVKKPTGVKSFGDSAYRIYYKFGNNYYIHNVPDMALNYRMRMFIEKAILHHGEIFQAALSKSMYIPSICINRDSSNSLTSFYVLKVDDVEFIPCYRIADGEVGLYDTYNKVFLTNSGTGTITKGDDV